MKVLHITKTITSPKLEGFLGFGLKHAYAIAKLLGENHIICRSKDKKLHTIIWKNKVYLHLIPNLLLYLPLTIHIIKKHKIDLIVAQNPFINGIIATLASIITKKPLLCTVHGYDFTINLKNWKFKTLQWPLRKIVLKMARRITCDTKAVRNVLISWGVEPRKIVITGSYVDTKMFNPKVDGRAVREKLGLKEDEPMILYCGRLVPVKGVERLLKAAKIVLKNIKNAHFVIVGDGPQRERLEKMAKELGIEESITFVGLLDYEEIPRYMAAADIYAHPAYSESFGKACAEASACAKPVVAFKVGGIPEVIIDGETGLLVENGNTKQYAKALIKLIKNEKMRKTMGEKGRKYIKRYEFEKRERKVAQVYRMTAKGV